jgi:hypothetical protein
MTMTARLSEKSREKTLLDLIRQYLWIGLAILSMTVLWACSDRSDQVGYKVVRTRSPITLDGRLDEWGAAQRLAMGRQALSYGGWLDRRDLDANVYLMWDQDYLYVAYRVADDDPVESEAGGVPIGDHLSVSFKVTDPADSLEGSGSASDYTFLIGVSQSQGLL